MGSNWILQINAVSPEGQYVCIVAKIEVIFGKYPEHWLTFGDPLYILECLTVCLREPNKSWNETCVFSTFFLGRLEWGELVIWLRTLDLGVDLEYTET